MEKEIKTQGLISIGDLFRNSWDIYKKDFKKFLVIAVIFFGIAGLIMTFIGPEIPEDEFLFTLPWYLFFPIILVATFISILGSASLISAVKEVPKDWQIKEVIKEGWSKYWSFLLVSSLAGLVIGIGFLLFIVPGIILAVWFAFSVYTVICEDKRWFKALSRSKQLVKGRWWSVAIRVFAIIIVIFFLTMCAKFIPYLGQLAYMIFFTPFYVIYNYLIYQNLREIK